MLSHAGDKDNLILELKNSDSTAAQQYLLNVSDWHLDELKPDPLDSLGMQPFEPVIPAVIGKILPNAPAEKSGLKMGDTILEIDGRNMRDWLDVLSVITSHPNEVLSFGVLRGTEKITIPVTIGSKRNLFFHQRGFLGMASSFEWPAKLLRQNKYGPIEALPHAWQDVAAFTKMNFIILGKMLTGKNFLEKSRGSYYDF